MRREVILYYTHFCSPAIQRETARMRSELDSRYDMLEAANPGFDRTLFLTAFVTGAREGELLALRWTDLELTREGPGKMAIRRSLSGARLKGEEGRPRYFPPKTKAAAAWSRFRTN
jgi:integrase